MMRYLRVFGSSVVKTDLFPRGRSKWDSFDSLQSFFLGRAFFPNIPVVPPEKGRNPGRSDCDSRPRASHGWLLLALAASRNPTYLDTGSHSSKIYGPLNHSQVSRD